ncbi:MULTISPECIES: DUF982 domain-containing protein [unclassified Mesorhizobium]|uniref:DUF982 domain-containing protein n=2 Tax=unclassified Mesorhizobium TaxID=325217 RepID=UPI0026B2483A
MRGWRGAGQEGIVDIQGSGTGSARQRSELGLLTHDRLWGGGEMTALRRFERPVVVRVGRHSTERIVFDVNEAANILLRDLHRQTERRRVAMDACLQVLRGEAHPPAARRAFVAAALEPKILRSD